MATIYLTLTTRSDTNSHREVRIRFKHGKIDQQAKTNIFIPAEYWDDKKQQIIVPNFRLLNEEKKVLKQLLNDQSEKLNTLTTTIQTIFNETDKDSITPDWLKTTIDKYNFPPKCVAKVIEPEIKSLFQFTDKFIATAHIRKDKATGRPLAYNNIQQYRATEKHLKEFAQSMQKKDFDFSEINTKFYDCYVSYLQNLGFTQNSVGKHVRILKLILNEATAQNINTNANYEAFHVFSEETDTIYLNENELQQLKDADLSNIPHLDRVRDCFLLLAWTGCRFSDLGKVGETDIKDGFVTFRQQKTNNKVTIPLHPVVLDVLEKYNYNLPAEISNQRFNEYIKEACRSAGINRTETMTRTEGGKLKTTSFEKWEHVSSHTGRRSFCTNMYKRGLPTLMIMSISGHKTEKSFLKYIKVKQEEHADMMKKAWANIYQ
jgi:integrase